jgi:hypothetical protein
MLEAIGRRVQRVGFRNVKLCAASPTIRSLPARLTPRFIVDSHHEFPSPVALLSKLAASLKPGGRIGIVNFTKDGGGPGPPMSDRPDPQKVIDEAGQAASGW